MLVTVSTNGVAKVATVETGTAATVITITGAIVVAAMEAGAVKAAAITTTGTVAMGTKAVAIGTKKKDATGPVEAAACQLFPAIVVALVVRLAAQVALAAVM